MTSTKAFSRLAPLGLLVAATVFAACQKTTPTTQQSSPTAAATNTTEAPATATLTLEPRGRQGSLVAATRLRDAAAPARTLPDLVLVADEDEHAILILDATSGALKGKQKLNGRPSQLLVLENGQLAVTLRDEAKVVMYGVATPGAAPRADTHAIELREEYTLHTSTEPLALALSPASLGPQQLFVASGHGRTLEQFDLASKKKKVIFDIAQEPRAVVALEDGTVVVTHANAGVLTKIKGTEVTAMRLDEGDVFSRQGFALAAIGREAFVPDTFVMPEDASGSMRGVAAGYGGGTVCEQDGWHRGWVLDQKNSPLPATSKPPLATPVPVAANGFAQFNAKTLTPAIRSFDCVQVMSTSGTLRRIGTSKEGAPRALVTQLGTKCILPRAAAAHEERREIYVACLGTNRVEAIDLGKDSEAGDPVAPPRMSYGWPVPKGPMGLAVVGDTLFVWSQFDHRMTKIDVKESMLSSYAVPRDVEMNDKVALGRTLFHAAGDARISSDGRACASCHPDGLSDGIGWATPEGRRKPMILAGRIGEGPFGWRGEHKTLHEHIAKTIVSHLHGTGLDTASMDALSAYVKSLPGPPKDRAEISDDVRRGKDLFARGDTGCARCHNPDTNFTDGAGHDVGTGGKFRTPPLKLASAAMPYMHEGKYTKLDEFLRATDGKMGNTKQLSDQEFRALVTYVQSL